MIQSKIQDSRLTYSKNKKGNDLSMIFVRIYKYIFVIIQLFNDLCGIRRFEIAIKFYAVIKNENMRYRGFHPRRRLFDVLTITARKIKKTRKFAYSTIYAIILFASKTHNICGETKFKISKRMRDLVFLCIVAYYGFTIT